MKKIKIQLLSIFIFISLFAKADEGMWFLMFLDRLNHRDMQEMGLQLTAEEIYSINNSSLKDAIVQFNGGCTAELISNQGLLLTNHHCGYGSIAELSTPDDNILKNGFWAKDKSKERKPKALYVRFFVRMNDVSKRILKLVNDKMSEDEREKIITKEIKLIQEENSEDGKYVVSVKSFFKGNEYYYFVYQDYTDVRLVGTPPENIGKFGGDTDNWEWPRHTGDFSMFRVYADKDGNPAKFSDENIPLKPKKYLSIDISGVQENDFAMILGYPGRTNRWLPAQGINQNVNYAYPAWVEASENAMEVIKKHSNKSDQVRINYASNYARIANYWKNRKGMIKALKKHKTAAKKEEIETQFTNWAKKKRKRKKYKGIVQKINNYYDATNAKSAENNYLSILIRFSNYAFIPYRTSPLLKKYISTEDDKEKKNLSGQLSSLSESLYNNLDDELEEDLIISQVELYFQYLKKNNLLNSRLEFKKFYDDLVSGETSISNSIFYNKETFDAFSIDANMEMLINDPLYRLSKSLISILKTEKEEISLLKSEYKKAYRLLVKGLRESEISKIKYPDANSTLRLSYGKVSPLPIDDRNDAKINYYTTLTGTIAKYKADDPEFDLPAKLQDLYKQKDYGMYADKDGHLPVNFLTNNDITGGNSGSPVLNGKGELIGLAFDGNIEAMAGDVIFDDKLQKTINVDIRYVLFLIDKFAGASNIIDELSIIK